MELLRYSRDVYGQAMLEGVSFELVWVFIAVAAVIIVVHMAWSFVSQAASRKPDKTSA